MPQVQDRSLDLLTCYLAHYHCATTTPQWLRKAFSALYKVYTYPRIQYMTSVIAGAQQIYTSQSCFTEAPTLIYFVLEKGAPELL